MTITLTAGEKRSKMSTQEAHDIVARFQQEAMSSDGTVYKIDISGRPWNREAFGILKTFLQQHVKTVRVVNLSDVIASLLTEEGLEVTKGLAECFAESDLLEVYMKDNAMGPRGLERITPLFHNSHIECLDFTNCGLSYESMEMLRDYLQENDGRIANTLKELVLDRNMMGMDGARVVGGFLPLCKNLESFSYLGNRLMKGTTFLVKGILEMTKASGGECRLRRLAIDDCTLGSDEDEEDTTALLCEALESCPQLKELILRESNMENRGLTQLVESLAASKATLTHLILDAVGEVGEEGAQILAPCLETQVDSLRHFSFGYNELGDGGLCALMEPFKKKNCLETLLLPSNEIEDSGADCLSACAFPKLQKLDLDDNMDVPKKALKKRFPGIVTFGEDDESEEEDEEEKQAIDELVTAMGTSHLS